MSVATDIENLRQAVTLLLDAQRQEVSKRKDLTALALALHEAVQGQLATNELVRAELAEARDNHANLEVKFNALVDAQIRTEDHFKVLAESQAQTNRQLASLAATVSRLAERNGAEAPDAG